MSKLRVFALALLVAFSVAPSAAPVTGDVRFERKEAGSADVPPAIFQHWVHRVQYKCPACHNDRVGFAMKAGASPVTMDAIDDGKFCGACHKGKPAFGSNFNTCVRCHRN